MSTRGTTGRTRARARKSLVLAVASALALGLAGCGDGGGGIDADAEWLTSTDPVATGGLAWATGSTVTLGDGTTLDTGEPVRAFVVAGDGVFFVPGEEGEDDLQFSGADLFFVAPGEEPVDTGLDVAHDGIAVAPDGSRLAVLDADYEDGDLVMRFLDLADGRAYTSEDGTEADHEDPAWLLLESEVAILAAARRGSTPGSPRVTSSTTGRPGTEFRPTSRRGSP